MVDYEVPEALLTVIAGDPEIGRAVRDGHHGMVLRIFRQARGLTLEEAGRRHGYSAAYLSRVENGRRTLTLDVLRHLARAYRVPPGMLGLADHTVLPSASQRLRDARRTRGHYPRGDATRFIAAAIGDAPDHIADALQVPRGSSALRREQLTYRGDQPVRMSTTWVPGDIADQCPELLAEVPGDTGISGIIADATGRIATSGEDEVEACSAWPAAARRLGRKEGVPMLRTRMWWWDAVGVIQYSETVTPHSVRYPYDL